MIHLMIHLMIPLDDPQSVSTGLGSGLVPNTGPFYWHGLTLIPVWISNYMPSKMWDEITYPFLNFNGGTVEV